MLHTCYKPTASCDNRVLLFMTRYQKWCLAFIIITSPGFRLYSFQHDDFIGEISYWCDFTENFIDWCKFCHPFSQAVFLRKTKRRKQSSKRLAVSDTPGKLRLTSFNRLLLKILAHLWVHGLHEYSSTVKAPGNHFKNLLHFFLC